MSGRFHFSYPDDPGNRPRPRPYSYAQAEPRPNAFLSGLLCILAVIFLCILFVLLLLRAVNIPTVIRNTDINAVLEETGLSQEIMNYMEDLLYIESDAGAYNEHIDEYINEYGEYYDEYAEYYDEYSEYYDEYADTDAYAGVTGDYPELKIADVEKFLTSAAVSREVGGIVDDYAREFTQGNLDYHMTSADIMTAVRNLEPELEDLIGRRLTEAEYAYIEKTLNDNVEFRNLSVGTLLDEMDIDPMIPFIQFSAYLIWIALFLCAFLLIIIYVHHRQNASAALRAVSVPIIISGTIFLLAGALFSIYPELYGYTVYDMAIYLGGVAHVVRLYGLAFIAVGAIFILISVAVRIINDRNQMAGQPVQRRRY